MLLEINCNFKPLIGPYFWSLSSLFCFTMQIDSFNELETNKIIETCKMCFRLVDRLTKINLITPIIKKNIMG
jgi:hypothetical protein